MFYVYILQSIANENFYVGLTGDLRERIKKHNAGKVKSTRPYIPWKIVYYEAHLTKTLARKAELFYKTGQGRRQLKKKFGFENH